MNNLKKALFLTTMLGLSVGLCFAEETNGEKEHKHGPKGPRCTCCQCAEENAEKCGCKMPEFREKFLKMREKNASETAELHEHHNHEHGHGHKHDHKPGHKHDHNDSKVEGEAGEHNHKHAMTPCTCCKCSDENTEKCGCKMPEFKEKMQQRKEEKSQLKLEKKEAKKLEKQEKGKGRKK